MNGYMRRDRQVSSAMLQSLQYDWLYICESNNMFVYDNHSVSDYQ